MLGLGVPRHRLCQQIWDFRDLSYFPDTLTYLNGYVFSTRASLVLPRYCMPAAPTPANPPQHHHPNLSASSPVQACPYCEALIDTSEREPLETILCPDRGAALQLNGEIGGFQ